MWSIFLENGLYHGVDMLTKKAVQILLYNLLFEDARRTLEAVLPGPYQNTIRSCNRALCYRAVHLLCSKYPGAHFGTMG